MDFLFLSPAVENKPKKEKSDTIIYLCTFFFFFLFDSMLAPFLQTIDIEYLSTKGSSLPICHILINLFIFYSLNICRYIYIYIANQISLFLD